MQGLYKTIAACVGLWYMTTGLLALLRTDLVKVCDVCGLMLFYMVLVTGGAFVHMIFAFVNFVSYVNGSKYDPDTYRASLIIFVALTVFSVYVSVVGPSCDGDTPGQLMMHTGFTINYYTSVVLLAVHTSTVCTVCVATETKKPTVLEP